MNTENQAPEALAATGGSSAPILPEKAGFFASSGEIAAALALFFLAWGYFEIFSDRIWLCVFTLGIIGLTELLHWERRRSGESWFWLGCLLCILAGILLHRQFAREEQRVWSEDQCFLFLHLCAVWWILHRSGTLLEGRSGHLLPLDGLDGFIVFPFKHFFLRVRCLFNGGERLIRAGKKPVALILWSLGAVLGGGLLFFLATRLLQAADQDFDRLVVRLLGWLSAPDWEIDWTHLFFSLPVGAWLFGLLAGTGREARETLDRRAGGWNTRLEGLRRVPGGVLSAICACFCLLYLCFFALQSRYLFGAFTRTLPEGFIVSQYARQGFFELCRVMAVNFALLWLLGRLSRRPIREDKPLLILSLLLLAESLLLAAVALSKLWLYIDCFGFTPLRLQSSWLVCVLILGCVAAGRHILTGRESLRPWLFAAAGSLSLLCLV